MKFSRISTFVLFSASLSLAAVYAWLHAQDDTVALSNTSGQENGILVSGQASSGIISDKPYTSLVNALDVQHLSAAPSRNEVIAFTNSRPVAINTWAKWTTGADSIPVVFANQIEIPVTIWIVQSPFVSQSTAAATRCLLVEAMWTSERMGVAFGPGGCQIMDATVGSNVAFQDCGNQSGFETRFGKTPARINIYVVNTVKVNSASSNGNGFTCGNDFIALGSAVDAGVFIHELGHAFSLTHIDWVPDFDANNIMHSSSPTRQYFTEGQIFRSHFTPSDPLIEQPGSALNSLYVTARAGQPTRDCTKDPCPPLDKRVWADGALPQN